MRLGNMLHQCQATYSYKYQCLMDFFIHNPHIKSNFNFFVFYKLQKIQLTCCFSALRLSSCSLKITKSCDFSWSSCFVLCSTARQPSGLSEDASEMTQMCLCFKIKTKILTTHMNQQEGHEKILIFKEQAKIKQGREDTPFTTFQ